MIGRRELKRLKQSVLVSLFDLLGKWHFIPGEHFSYNSTLGSIKFPNGSEFVLMDLAPTPSDPNYERLGSLEFTGGFIEEAAEVEEKAKEVVLSRLRYRLEDYQLTPKLLLTCNPHKGYLYRTFYKPWRTGTLSPDKAFVRSLVTDNTHISPSYIESLKKIRDKVLRARLLLGDWEYSDDDLSLFNYDALTDMFTNNLKNASTERYIVADIARFGVDKAVISAWEGLRAYKWITIDKSRLTRIESDILVLMQTEHVPLSHVLVDEDGVGGGVVDHLKCKGFVGNSSPIDERTERELREVEYKINYQNLRTQCYYELAERVNARMIRVDTESVTMQDEIVEELEQMKAADVDKDTKFRIISKDDIKAQIGRSPDYADTLMMRMWFELHKEKGGAVVHSSNVFD